MTESLDTGFPDPEGNPHPKALHPQPDSLLLGLHRHSFRSAKFLGSTFLPRSAGTQLICWVSPSWDVARTGGWRGKQII